jgi:hypothetical protein
VKAPRRTAFEGGAGLDGQLVGRQVFGPEADGGLELLGPAGLGLAGAGVDQVQRQAGEEAGGQPRGAHGFGGRVIAAEELQRPVVERLDAEGQTIDARLGEGLEALGLGVGGIGLQRHLEVRRRGPERPGRLDDPGRPLRPHQGRGAAAEEDRDQAVGTGGFGLGAKVSQYRLEQRLGLAGAAVQRHVEVAVGADAGAVGPVDVETQRGKRVTQTGPP